jgi:hypothetical protein
LSGSPNRSGENSTRTKRRANKSRNPKESLIVKYGWNGILSESELIPDGLFDPVSCRNRKWTIASAAIIKGRIKWNVKNWVKVALSTENPPEIHSTRLDSMYGIAESRLVITVAPQNDICPHGRTYPIKAVAMTVNSKIIPMFHVSMKVYDL